MKNILKKILENKFVDYFLILLIVFNIVCLGLETDKTIYLTYKTFFSKVELVSVIIFTIEYIMRLFTLNKLKDMFQPLMIIDLLAILPFYLPLSRLDLRILRIFRLFRILRIFKLARYFEALQMIGKVIYKKRTELISIFGVLLFLIFLSSFFMFYAEAEAQQ